MREWGIFMNTIDLEQIRKKLESEYNHNCTEINKLNEKILIIETNKFKMRVSNVVGIAFVHYFIFLLILLPIIINFGVIPLQLIQPLSIGIPLVIGIIDEEIITRKRKYREKLRKFSKSTTQKEKLEEALRYEIKAEKLKNINKVLEKSYDNLLESEKMFCSFSKNYNIVEKARNEEDIRDSILNTNELLLEKQHDIDIATTKCVLKNKFFCVRDKLQRNFNMFLCLFVGGGFCMMVSDLPLICMARLENIQFLVNFFNLTINSPVDYL